MSGAFLLMMGIATRIASFGGTVNSNDPSSPYSSTAGVTLETDGSITVTLNPPGSESVGTAWALPVRSDIGNDWSVRATLSAGTTPTTNAGLGVWLALSSARTWSNLRTAIGGTTSTLLFEFSRDGGATIDPTTSTVILAADAG